MKTLVALFRSQLDDKQQTRLSDYYAKLGFDLQIIQMQSEACEGAVFRDTCLSYCEFLQEALRKRRTFSTAVAPMPVLVESLNVGSKHFNLISEGCHWERLIAVLVMVFPEINWFFGPLYYENGEFPDNGDGGKESLDHIISLFALHSLDNLQAFKLRCSLFDASGFRSWLRNRKVGGDQRQFSIPERTEAAACVDDEIDYAIFHALVCYRFGYRAVPIDSWTEMQSELGSNATKYRVLIEDMSLNFFDSKSGIHLSSFKERDYKLRKEDPDSINESHVHRVLVTTGQEKPHSEEDKSSTLEDNKVYLKIKAAGSNPTNSIRTLVLKPTGGVIDFWKNAGFFRSQTRGKDSANGRDGNADGFVFPRNCEQVRAETRYSGHGAIGGHALAAELMLFRARYLLRESQGTFDLAVVAVLAIDAGELVEGKSMHLATESSMLKHEAEVLIESEFSGIGCHVNEKLRLKEVKEECEAWATWLHAKKKKQFEKASQLSILQRLSCVYRDGGMLEEYEGCLREVRSLNRSLAFCSIADDISVPPDISVLRRFALKACWPFRYAWHFVTNSLLRYCEFALRGLSWLWGLIAFWVVFFTFTWVLVWGKASGSVGDVAAGFGRYWPNFEGGVPSPLLVRFLSAYEEVAGSFWEYDVETNSLGQALFSTGIVVVAVIHLALLVASLYSLVSRR
jgi:hypothetical protein